VSYRDTGYLFGHQILSILRKDVFVLGITDGVMFGSTFLCVVLQKSVFQGWINWNNWGWLLQHVTFLFRGLTKAWQFCFLSGTVGWAFFREWEWPQTVFIVLHCLVLLMKQHSYAFYSGWLSNEYLRLLRLRKELAALKDDEDNGLSRVTSIAEERERLVREIEAADRSLTGTVAEEVSYPDNLTYANFLDYMFCPTLIYELEYPRTDRYVTGRKLT
jgi:sterol O-acyltransferase